MANKRAAQNLAWQPRAVKFWTGSRLIQEIAILRAEQWPTVSLWLTEENDG